MKQVFKGAENLFDKMENKKLTEIAEIKGGKRVPNGCKPKTENTKYSCVY